MARNFLYFAESDVQESQDACMIPADSYLGCDIAAGGVALRFEDVEGHQTRETITLACASGNQKAVLDAFVSIANSNPHSGGFIVVADANVANGQTATYHKAFNGLVTNCTIA